MAGCCGTQLTAKVRGRGGVDGAERRSSELQIRNKSDRSSNHHHPSRPCLWIKSANFSSVSSPSVAHSHPEASKSLGKEGRREEAPGRGGRLTLSESCCTGLVSPGRRHRKQSVERERHIHNVSVNSMTIACAVHPVLVVTTVRYQAENGVMFWRSCVSPTVTTAAIDRVASGNGFHGSGESGRPTEIGIHASDFKVWRVRGR